MNARADLFRALELHRAGRLAEAESAYSSYLAEHPDDAEALNNAGIAALQGGDAALSVSRLERLVALYPRHAQGLNNLGYALVRAGRSEAALGFFERVVALQPDYVVAWNNLGIAHENLAHRDEAIRAFERALAIAPLYAEVAVNLGKVLNREGDTARARAVLERALAAQPSHTGLRAVLGATDALEGRLESVLSSLERAVVASPAHALAWDTLGMLRTWAGDPVAGEAAYRRALALDPKYRESWVGLSGTLLAQGHFEEGWRAFEQRAEGCLGGLTRFPQIAQWDGRPLDGVLLLTCEQGLGDVVQFSRFVPAALRRARRVVLLADEPRRSLAPLLATLAGLDEVIDAPALDRLAERPLARASVLSLPYLLGVRIEDLPGPIPYLDVPEDRGPVWKAKLAAVKRPRIGLAWAAFARPELGYITRQKSVPLGLLAPVVTATDAAFVSLQLGPAENLAARPDLAAKISDFTADIRDFADTAAIISELDLVISTDTSVAHVAGALGKDVWMLDRFNTDWRWRLAADRSPWYPTMRIFRQDRFGDWSGPLGRLAVALHELDFAQSRAGGAVREDNARSAA